MKLPFLQHAGIGLTFTSAHVRWAEFSRIRDRVRLVRRACEPVGEEESAEQALVRLAGRLKPAYPFAATHLPPACVQEWVAEAPHFDIDAARARWIEAHVQERLPGAASAEHFAVRHRVLSSSSEGARCLVSVARREAVVARAALLRAAGLTPVYVGGFAATIGYAYGFEAAFSENRSAVLLMEEGHAQLACYEEGALTRLWTLSPPEAERPGGHTGSAWSDEALGYLEETEASKAAAPAGSTEASSTEMNVYAAGAASALSRAEVALGRSVHMEAALPGARLSAADAPAAGLALAALYGAGEDANALGEKDREAARQAGDRHDALRAMALMGLLLALLWGGSWAASEVLERRLGVAQQELAASADQVERLRKIATDLGGLEARLRVTEALVTRRTHAAALLEEVARSASPGLWLREIIVAKSPEGSGPQALLTLTGLALGEGDVSALMRALERRPAFSGVQLAYAERLSAEEAERLSEAWTRPLTRFEVTLHAPLGSRRGAPSLAEETPEGEQIAER